MIVPCRECGIIISAKRGGTANYSSPAVFFNTAGAFCFFKVLFSLPRVTIIIETEKEKTIWKTKPYAVDASSAVEANGFKDYEKIKAFIERVRNE